MKYKFKKVFEVLMLSALLVTQPFTAFAASPDLLHETKKIQTLTEGVIYEKSSRLYKAGWMDVYVLTIDAQNPNVAMDVIQSTEEFGLKQTIEAMANQNDVIAAVNGDFFGAGNPQSSMGQVIRNKNIDEAQNYYNFSDSQFAGIFVDENSTPFIDYLKTQMGFYNSEEAIIELQGKNKVTNFKKPIYFDRTAITSTEQIDSEVRGLTKIVVENDVITKISESGETVEIPENGYIIVMDKATRDNKIEYYQVGQTVSYNESGEFIFRPQKQISEIKFGISGGGEILRNGEIIKTGLLIGPNARNPRTVIGVDKDKTKIIIISVDGRKNGIGATHTEIGNLLLEYGAYDAIHFDGGGSTTVVIRPENERELKVENVPSEGAQRLVANGIGIKSTGGSSPLSGLNLYVSGHEDNKILAQTSVAVAAYGYDSNHNPSNINIDNIQFEHSGVEGTWNGNIFTPLEEGQATITATIGNVISEFTVDVLSSPTDIDAKANSTSLSEGESTYLTAVLVNKDGFESDLRYDQINWVVDNPQLGTVENGKFTAGNESGIANVTANYNGLSKTVSISVGKEPTYITSFENDMKLKLEVYPTDTGITGGTGRIDSQRVSGNSSFILNYNFVPNSTITQAVYMSFEDEPINLIGNPTDVALWVKGDNSNNMLKMLLQDSEDREYSITLCPEINFDNWQYVTSAIPNNVSYPVRVEKIYVAALQTTDNVSGGVYIDDLTQLAPRQAIDKSFIFNDYLNIDLSNPPEEGQKDLTVFGQTASRNSKNDDSILQLALSKMSQNARAMLFAGLTNIENTTDTVSVKWANEYEKTGIENLTILNIATNNGSIRTSDINQWRYIQSDIENSPNKNILLVMNKDIWASGGNTLNDKRESELLHSILSEFKQKTEKNIMVVAATGYNTSVLVKEGIRYITLNGLSIMDSNDINNYKYLRIRVDSENMYYDIKSIY